MLVLLGVLCAAAPFSVAFLAADPARQAATNTPIGGCITATAAATSTSFIPTVGSGGSRGIPTAPVFPTFVWPTAPGTTATVAVTLPPTETLVSPLTSTSTAQPSATPTITVTPPFGCDPNYPTGTPLATHTTQPTSTRVPSATMAATATAGSSTNTVESQSYTYNGSWTSYTGQSGFHNSDLEQNSGASSTTDYYQYTYTGTNFSLYTRRDVNFGKCELYIDTVDTATLDNYNGSQVKQYNIYNSSGLSQGSHTVKCLATGTKNASSSGYYLETDYLTYNNSATATPANTFTPAATYTTQPTATPIQSGITCETTTGNYHCNYDGGTSASVTYTSSNGDPQAGSSATILFQLTTATDEGMQIAWRVTAYHEEVSAFCGNKVDDELKLSVPTYNSNVRTLSHFLLSGTGCDVNAVNTGYYYDTVPAHNAFAELSYRIGTAADYAGAGGYTSYRVDVYIGTPCSNATVTPAVTSTPGPALPVCNGLLPPNTVAYVKLPSVTAGACYVVIPGITISMPTLTWSPITLPDTVSTGGFTVCVDTLDTAIILVGVDFLPIVSLMIGLFALAMIWREFRS